MSAAMAALFVLEVPEYAPLLRAAQRAPGVRVVRSRGYARVETPGELVVRRAETGLNEAVWFGALVAGYEGAVAEFTSDVIRIIPAGAQTAQRGLRLEGVKA